MASSMRTHRKLTESADGIRRRMGANLSRDVCRMGVSLTGDVCARLCHACVEDDVYMAVEQYADARHTAAYQYYIYLVEWYIVEQYTDARHTAATHTAAAYQYQQLHIQQQHTSISSWAYSSSILVLAATQAYSSSILVLHIQLASAYYSTAIYTASSTHA